MTRTTRAVTALALGLVIGGLVAVSLAEAGPPPGIDPIPVEAFMWRETSGRVHLCVQYKGQGNCMPVEQLNQIPMREEQPAVGGTI